MDELGAVGFAGATLPSCPAMSPTPNRKGSGEILGKVNPTS